MRKELYLFAGGKPERTVIRNYDAGDFRQLIEVQKASFPPPFPEELLWNAEQLAEHATRFPEGALCAEIDGRLIGSMTGLIVNMDDYGHAHDWETITGGGYIRNHNPSGDTLYVVDICVIPEYRKSGIGKWLMQTMYETVVQLGLDRLLGGGRMPGYAQHAHEATPEAYLENVVNGVWKDPVVTFLLRCGRMPVGVAREYLEDEQSNNCAAIMEWRNPFK
ncbi:GNAT family N-acetyltransferase [Paenibacillus arenilitoris]|uniref:GNAT family N-acetyltransferase n=1 Tax=Paenibacillus arenilitoris TaxID=2772299 RepID=A0A927CLL6_9BACL|nr:GNAT family N-acetyltransferase [Paenibacillus arenilitoris]MBD2869799.1 GNAT family N-acetyltransferase [Paenibacillus arenilitoris]